MRNGAAGHYRRVPRAREEQIEGKKTQGNFQYTIHHRPTREVERDRGNVPKERGSLKSGVPTGKKDESNIEDNNLMTITLLLEFVW